MSPSEDDPGTGGEQDTFADGGELGDIDIFTQTSSSPPPSRLERFDRLFSLYVRAPLAIAWNDYRTRIGLLIIITYILLGTVGVALLPEPRALQGPAFATPSLEFPFGTDNVGRNVFYQIVHATPAMFKMIISGGLLSVVLGVVIGTLSGYKGGKLDVVLMSLTDIVLTIPGLALVIVIAAFFPAESPWIVGLILGIDNWPNLSRNIRSQVLSIREEAYVEASRAMGLSKSRILRRDFIAQLMPYISINVANSGRRIIFESVGLYYLGILPFTTLNWGVVLNLAYNNTSLQDLSTMHWLVAPMMTIAILTLGLILFAQGLDRVFNVRLRARHAAKGEEEPEPHQLQQV